MNSSAFGIYRIVSPSGKMYIGLTLTSFQERWKGHRKLLARGRPHCKGLQRACDKYGEQNLNFSVLELVIYRQQTKLCPVGELADPPDFESGHFVGSRPTWTA